MSRHHDAIKNDPRYKRWTEEVKRAAGYRCEDCGDDRDLTADHVLPLDQGGEPFDVSNGACLCRPCNSRKGNRTAIRANWYNEKWLDSL